MITFRSEKELKKFLDLKVDQINRPAFIKDDPISIPKKYSLKQDIEITAFWTAMFAWGQRVTIINKAKELFSLMDNAPYDFILNHSESDRKRFESFKHRTFQFTDTLYFLEFFQWYYQNHQSLEEAFNFKESAKEAITGFHNLFFSLPHAPRRTQKHLATPAKKSTCKRINMFLRWMVRDDKKGVDFGLWKSIHPKDLMIPFDVHVERVATKLGLLTRKQRDWQAVEELTEKLRAFDSNDPVKYDYALYGLGVLKEL